MMLSRLACVRLLLAPAFFITALFLSNELAAEDGVSCQSKVFDRFIKVEKKTYLLSNQPPDEELQIRMSEYEILCPWQVEVDFNGDKTQDWAGLVKYQGKTLLFAYVSTLKGYQGFIVKEYNSFPKETHLSYLPLRQVTLVTKKPLPQNKISGYALVENKIGKPSTIYLWKEPLMVSFAQFKGNY